MLPLAGNNTLKIVPALQSSNISLNSGICSLELLLQSAKKEMPRRATTLGCNEVDAAAAARNSSRISRTHWRSVALPMSNCIFRGCMSQK